MMHLTGFKSKAALKEHVKLAAAGTVDPVIAEDHLVETSMFGNEYKPGREQDHSVCLDHPKRTKFARIHINVDGYITKVA